MNIANVSLYATPSSQYNFCLMFHVKISIFKRKINSFCRLNIKQQLYCPEDGRNVYVKNTSFEYFVLIWSLHMKN